MEDEILKGLIMNFGTDAKVRPSKKGLSGTNTLAYRGSVKKKKKFFHLMSVLSMFNEW
jgi:hypothetical protein